jgi:hypothetical protein
MHGLDNIRVAMAKAGDRRTAAGVDIVPAGLVVQEDAFAAGGNRIGGCDEASGSWLSPSGAARVVWHFQGLH